MTATGTATSQTLSATRRITGVALASVSGVAVAVQINGELGVRLADTIAGQVVSALLLDLVLPTPASHPGVTTLLGAALTMVAVLIAALAPPAPAPRAAPSHDRWPRLIHSGSCKPR
ncbi:hypothetical protein [Micromonospora profundi]|uniref:hypothetical protein n=1 Tax=Micromonospora profundi TaxID=1420889 RepID=UPI00364BFF77